MLSEIWSNCHLGLQVLHCHPGEDTSNIPLGPHGSIILGFPQFWQKRSFRDQSWLERTKGGEEQCQPQRDIWTTCVSPYLWSCTQSLSSLSAEKALTGLVHAFSGQGFPGSTHCALDGKHQLFLGCPSAQHLCNYNLANKTPTARGHYPLGQFPKPQLVLSDPGQVLFSVQSGFPEPHPEPSLI